MHVQLPVWDLRLQRSLSQMEVEALLPEEETIISQLTLLDLSTWTKMSAPPMSRKLRMVPTTAYRSTVRRFEMNTLLWRA